MDYSAFHEFPFPSALSDVEQREKRYFLSLSDNLQLKLLNGCQSYQEFSGRVLDQMIKSFCRTH